MVSKAATLSVRAIGDSSGVIFVAGKGRIEGTDQAQAPIHSYSTSGDEPVLLTRPEPRPRTQRHLSSTLCLRSIEKSLVLLIRNVTGKDAVHVGRLLQA